MAQLRDVDWEAMVELLRAYKDKHGTCKVPDTYWDDRLVQWVQYQRTKRWRGRLALDKKSLLDEIGFDWGTGLRHVDVWWSKFDKVCLYLQRHGSADADGLSSMKKLVPWLQTQAKQVRRGKLAESRAVLLKSFGLQWLVKVPWEDTMASLIEYRMHHGCVVNMTLAGLDMDSWLSLQAELMRRGKNEEKRTELLQSFGLVPAPCPLPCPRNACYNNCVTCTAHALCDLSCNKPSLLHFCPLHDLSTHFGDAGGRISPRAPLKRARDEQDNVSLQRRLPAGVPSKHHDFSCYVHDRLHGHCA
jgi:hypothetical protein